MEWRFALYSCTMRCVRRRGHRVPCPLALPDMTGMSFLVLQFLVYGNMSKNFSFMRGSRTASRKRAEKNNGLPRWNRNQMAPNGSTTACFSFADAKVRQIFKPAKHFYNILQRKCVFRHKRNEVWSYPLIYTLYIIHTRANSVIVISQKYSMINGLYYFVLWVSDLKRDLQRTLETKNSNGQSTHKKRRIHIEWLIKPFRGKLLLLQRKAATASGKSWCCFREKLLLLQRKAGAASGKSCYCFRECIILCKSLHWDSYHFVSEIAYKISFQLNFLWNLFLVLCWLLIYFSFIQHSRSSLSIFLMAQRQDSCINEHFPICWNLFI